MKGKALPVSILRADECPRMKSSGGAERAPEIVGLHMQYRDICLGGWAVEVMSKFQSKDRRRHYRTRGSWLASEYIEEEIPWKYRLLSTYS